MADRAAFAVAMLVEGHPQAFVDFFYLTHAALPDAEGGAGEGALPAAGAAGAGLAGAEAG